MVSKVGRELYEKFFRGYTRKQWGLDPSRARRQRDRARARPAPTATTATSPTSSRRCRCTATRAMFENMLDHPNIKVMLNTDYRDDRRTRSPCDTPDLHRARSTSSSTTGSASCRTAACDSSTRRWTRSSSSRSARSTIRTTTALHPHQRVQAHHRAGMRQDHARLRISRAPKATRTTRCRGRRTRSCIKQVRGPADATPDVTFVGRLATYRYYNMDQVVGQALAAFKQAATRRTQPRTGGIDDADRRSQRSRTAA